MPNRYSKLPRRTHIHMVRLTDAEERTAQWLARRLGRDGKDLAMSEVFRLVLGAPVVAVLIGHDSKPQL